MDYKEAVEWVFSCHNPKRGKGNACFRHFLELCGNPQKNIRYIHVAGTNGKGSICAYISSVLSTAGFRCGMFTSPHIYRINERIRVNGTEIPDEVFAEIITYIAEKQNDFTNLLERPLIPFEILTLCGFLYFQRMHCSVVVMEVGIGGLYDATNVIEPNDLAAAVIAHIGFDHTEILGNTLDSISSEKAGIIKENSFCVAMAQNQIVLDIIRKRCEVLHSTFRVADWHEAKLGKMTLKNTIFSYSRLKKIEIRLAGLYELANACTALTVIEVLLENGWSIPEHCILEGMKNTRWGGRFELLQEKPLVIVDGAHNAQGITSFLESTSSLLPDHKLRIVIGILADKDIRPVIPLLCKHGQKIYAETPPSARALSANCLAELLAAQSTIPIALYPSAEKALQAVLGEAQESDCICVIGSLYQVAQIRQYFGKKSFYD